MENDLPIQSSKNKNLLANKKLVILLCVLLLSILTIIILLFTANRGNKSATSNTTPTPSVKKLTVKSEFAPPLFAFQKFNQPAFITKVILDTEIFATKISLSANVDSDKIEAAMFRPNDPQGLWQIVDGFYNPELRLVTLVMIPNGKKVALANNPIATLSITPKKGLTSTKATISFNQDSYIEIDTGEKYYLEGEPVTIMYPEIAPILR